MQVATQVRRETALDVPAADGVVLRAFTGTGASVLGLVRALRADAGWLPEYALVAERDGVVVGHTQLSRCRVRAADAATYEVLTLSPLSVDPPVQRTGVGSVLVRAVCALADAAGEPMILLQGSPRYYGRFGFVASAGLGISMDLPGWAPREAAQVLPLAAYDPAVRGHLELPPAFDGVE